MQCLKLNILRFLLVLSYLILSGTQVFASENSTLAVSLTSSFSITPDPKNTQSSLGLEPLIKYHFTKAFDLQFYSSIDRPMDAYQNFSVPLVSLTPGLQLSNSVIKTKLSLFIGVLDLDQMKSEGMNVRVRPTLLLSAELVKDLSLTLRLGPYYMLSEYRQTTTGKDRVRFGLNEKIGLAYKLGSFSFDLSLIFDQKYSTLWKNDYATSESVEFSINEALSVGVGHTLSASPIDESTGFKKNPQIFDSRQSRFSLFMQVSL